MVQAANVQEEEEGEEVGEEEEEEDLGTRDGRRIIIERRSPKKNVAVWTEIS